MKSPFAPAKLEMAEPHMSTQTEFYRPTNSLLSNALHLYVTRSNFILPCHLSPILSLSHFPILPLPHSLALTLSLSPSHALSQFSIVVLSLSRSPCHLRPFIIFSLPHSLTLTLSLSHSLTLSLSHSLTLAILRNPPFAMDCTVVAVRFSFRV